MRTITDSPPGPAAKARDRPVVWLPTTRAGKVELTLAYLTVLSPFWVFVVLGQAVFQAGASDDVVIAMLVVTVAALWASLFWARERSLLVAAFTMVLSAVLLFMGWSAAVSGFPGAH